MLVWNDIEADENQGLRQGVQFKNGELLSATRKLSHRTCWAPRVEQVEALKAEAAYFMSA